jgi:hypothetical protein
MNPETRIILKHIEKCLATGVIPDALIPYYDQHGKWFGAPGIWFHTKRNPRLDRINSSYLPAPRRTWRDRSGTILRTSYIWRGNTNVCMTYSKIKGSLILEGNTMIDAPWLRVVEGSLIITTSQRVCMPNLRQVDGRFDVMQTFDLLVPRLHHIGGRAKMLGCIPPLLRTVGGSLGVYWCFKAESDRLKCVGDYLALTKAATVKLSDLESIGGSFLLTSLTHVIHTPRLHSVGGDMLAESVHDLRASALRRVGGNLDTSSAKGFFNPRIKVGGAWAICPGDAEDWYRRDAARRAMKQDPIML